MALDRSERLQSIGWRGRATLFLMTGVVSLAGVACDGVIGTFDGAGQATDATGYEFSRDIESVLADREAAEPDHDAPYTGTLRTADGEDFGAILLSTCGCGFWRSYIETGEQRTMGRLVFADFPDSFARFESDEGESPHIVGAFIDGGERAFGEAVIATQGVRFFADRNEDEPTLGCLSCHVGEDPPRPLPPTHRAVTEATDCLACHEVGGH